jgi:tetratricopeptide (TPR) repeat protein
MRRFRTQIPQGLYRGPCSLVGTLGLAALMVCAFASEAAAQGNRDQARQLYAQGQALFDAGNYAGAEASFRQAYAASPNPVVLRAIATAQQHQGNVAGERQTLQEYVAANPNASDRAEVEARLASLGGGGDPADPSLGEPPPEEGVPPPDPSAGVWILAGVAALGLVSGTVFGFLALNEQSSFDNMPSHEIADRGEIFALVADISFGVAGAAAIAAIILYIVEATSGGGGGEEDYPPPEPMLTFRVSPWATPEGGGAAAMLRF